MSFTHAEVIKRYEEAKPNRNRGGKVEWEGGNIKCDADALYSYGVHYVLAWRLGDGRFLKNADRVSNTTAGHIAQCSHLPGPATSFSTLLAAGVYPEDLRPEHILEIREDQQIHVHRAKDSGRLFTHDYKQDDEGEYTRDNNGQLVDEYKPWTPPNVGMFMPYANAWSEKTDPNLGELREGIWHVLGAMLLRFQDRTLLCTTDDGTYCVIECPGDPRTIDEAFASIAPEGLTDDCLRQGEWFFCPTGQDDQAFAAAHGLTVADLRRTALRYALPDSLFSEVPRPDSRNIHEARVYETPTEVYASGKVYHKGRDRWSGRVTGMSGEHRTVDLGTEWYRVLRAREIASWTQDRRTNRGGVD